MSDGLTRKQKAFADYYIKYGNATKAARLAGYSEKSVRYIGAENLTKPNISEYIRTRTKPAEEKRVATGDEVLQFLTRVMNGEEKDAFGLDVSIDARIKAATELAKRTCDIKEDKNDERITIINNIPKPDTSD